MTYADIAAMNFSSLKHMATSPLLYRWRVDHPQPPKAAYTIGSAIHCAILEPALFASRYAVFNGVRRGKAWDAWQEEHPGVESLKPDEFERVEQSALAARSHRCVAPLLGGGRFELAVEWVDSRTGLACKGRVDYVSPTRLIDLKSAREIDGRNFRRAVAQYLYHGQLAWYYDGCIAAGVLSPSAGMPLLIAQQNVEPYDVGVYRMTADDLSKGRQLYWSLLDQFTACTAANMWPGAVPDVVDLMVPDWAPGSYPDATEDF